MENIKNEINNTNTVGKKSQPIITKEQEKSNNPFNLTLKMSVMDASIVYEKTENEFGGMENTEIEKGISLSYINVEQKDGEDFINEQKVYIDYKWDLFKERGDELINKLSDKDIELLEPQENKGLFAKGFKITGKTSTPTFTLNRSMKMKIMTVIDKSSTFNKKTTTKTEIATIFKGAKMKKIAINLKDIPKSQVEKLKGKEVLIENITIYCKEGSYNNIYSTSSLPKEI
jgi:hypothetical protein